MGSRIKSFFLNKRIIPLAIFFTSILLTFSRQYGFSQTQTFAWEYSFGDAQSQEATAVAYDPSTSTVVSGGIFQGNIIIGDTNFTSPAVDNIWLSKMDAAGNVLWALNAPSASNDKISDIALDDFGNIFIIGSYTTTTIFTGTLGSTFSLTSQGAEDIFVVKFNAAGEIQWAESFGGTGQDFGGGITTQMGNDNVFITGSFSGAATFQSPPILNSSGVKDAFIMALHRVTALKTWIRQGACAEDAEGIDITADGSGIYATGNYFGNSPLSFDNFGSSLSNLGVGGENMFVVKYTLNGVGVWQRYAGNGSGFVNSYGVSTSGGTTVYVTGTFDGFTTFSTTFAFVSANSSGLLDVFLVGYDRNTGQVLNLDGFGGPGNDIGTSLSLSSSNDIFLSATYDDTMFVGTDTLVPTATDAMVASFNQTGAAFQWSLPITGNSNQSAVDISAPNGLIFIAGFLEDVSSFNPYTSSYFGLRDAFVARIGCPSRLSPNLLDSLAGADTTVCINNSIVLAADTLPPFTGQWNILAGSGSLSSNADPDAVLTPNASGTIELEWELASGSCIIRDTVLVSVPATFTPEAGPDTVICDTFYTMIATDPSPNTGTWNLISGSGNIASPSQFNSPVNGLAPGTNVFEWEVNDGSCTLQDTVTITVALTPIQNANAGGNIAVCGDTITLAGNNPLPNTGTWAIVSGGGTFSNINDSNAFVSNLNNGINEFSWTISNGTCSTSDTLVVVSDAPIFANAGIDSSICSTTIPLSGNAPIFSSGGWEVASGGGTIVSPFLPFTNAVNMTSGTNEFAWILIRGACSDTDTVTITVFSPPTPANAGLDQSLCNDTITTLSGNSPVTGTGTWSLISGPANIVSPGNPASNVNGLQTGTATFEWEIANGICPVSRDTVGISVTLEIPSNAGPDQALCDTLATTLAGSPTGTGTGTWTVVAGTGNFANANSPGSDVGGLAPGLNQLVWTIVNGPCITTDTVDINVTIFSSTVNAGPDQFLCDTQTVFLAAVNPAPGTGAWSVIAGTPPTFSSLANPNATLSNTSFGVTNLQWTVIEGACSYQDTVAIDIANPPPPANAGPDQSLCDTVATTLAGSDTTGVIGTWTLLNGTGAFANSGDSNTVVSGLAPNLNQFVWTTTAGPCTTTDTVDINVTISSVIPNAGPDQELCGIQAATMAANDPSPATGIWTAPSGSPSISSATDSSATVSNLQLGTNSLVWTITEGACVYADTVNLNITQLPPVPHAGTDQALCDTFSTNLDGSDPMWASGAWTVLSGTGTVANANDSATTINVLSSGSNLITWTTTNGNCELIDTLEIFVTIPSVLPDAGPDQSICLGDTAFISGNTPPAIGTGNWSLPSSLGSIDDPNALNTFIINFPLGVQPVVWLFTENVCVRTDTSFITVLPIPTPVAGQDQFICDTTSTSLEGLAFGNGTGTWSVLNGPATLSNPADSNAVLTNLVIGTATLVWNVDNGSCDASDTVDITVIDPPSNANAGTDQSICDLPTSTLNAQSPVIGTGSWTSLGPANVDNPNDPNSTITGLQTGTNTFVWTVSLNLCQDRTDTVDLSVTLPPVVDAGQDDIICEGDSTVLNGLPFSGLGLWSDLSGNANFSHPDSNITEVTNLSPGANGFVLTVIDGPCVVEDTAYIQVDLLPTTADAGDDRDVPNDFTNLEGNTPVVGTGIWTILSGDGIIADQTSATSEVTNMNLGENIFVWTIANGTCPSNADSVRIQVLDLLIPTGFSPNGDGTNDTWVIRGGQNFGNVEVQVFNRWGNIVFQTKNYNNDWQGRAENGSELADDTYYYIVNLGDGTTSNGYVVIKR